MAVVTLNLRFSSFSFYFYTFFRLPILLLYYGKVPHLLLGVMTLDSLATGVSPLLLRVQQPPVPQGRATTSNHGLRVPDLPKRRRNCGQWSGVSERSFERHKVSPSIDHVSFAENFGQRTSGCHDGSRPGPDPGKRIVLPLNYIRSFFFDQRHTPTFLVQTAAMRSTHFCLLLGGNSHCSPVRV